MCEINGWRWTLRSITAVWCDCDCCVAVTSLCHQYLFLLICFNVATFCMKTYIQLVCCFIEFQLVMVVCRSLCFSMKTGLCPVFPFAFFLCLLIHPLLYLFLSLPPFIIRLCRIFFVLLMKMDLKEMWCEGVDWIYLVQGRVCWWAVVIIVIKVLLPQKVVWTDSCQLSCKDFAV